MSTSVSLRYVAAARDVDAPLRRQLLDCWVAVTNAGGAVGFPWPPVTRDDVEPVLDALIGELDPAGTRLVVADDADGVAGWVAVHRNASALIAHWATVRRLQTIPRLQGRGIGTLLMHEVSRMARDDLGLEHLHLELRGGMGLEGFYERLGWRQIGRWPSALRLSDGDDRDEILMVLELS